MAASPENRDRNAQLNAARLAEAPRRNGPSFNYHWRVLAPGGMHQDGNDTEGFYDSAAIADTKVKGLLTEVESFTQVLCLMKDTLEQENI